MNILIKDHKDSLESIQRDGQIIYMIGPGVLKSPGHPGGNQQFYRQLNIFRVACKEPYLFKMYNKDLEGHTEYLGEYKVLEYKIRISFAGFRYYEYKMVRINPFIPSKLE